VERGNPVRRWGAVIPDPPLLRQLGHRIQLILDHTQVSAIDRVPSTNSARRKTPRTNPATDSLGIPTQPIGSLSNSQHADIVRQSAVRTSCSARALRARTAPFAPAAIRQAVLDPWTGQSPAQQCLSCRVDLAHPHGLPSIPPATTRWPPSAAQSCACAQRTTTESSLRQSPLQPAYAITYTCRVLVRR
jgi:hypothetical protein